MSTESLEKDAVHINTKSKKHRNPWLLILLILSLILFLLTTAILGSRLYELATRDQHTIDLVLGYPEGTIELFRVEYENELNEITVQGINTEDVISPGTSVTYDVRLKNNEDMIIDFVMTPTVDFLNADTIPIQFRIIDAYGNYILGDDSTWVGINDMNALVHKGTIHPGEIFTYHVSWQWAFDVSGEQDIQDTYLGNQGGDALPGVRVGITTDAAPNPTPVRSHNHVSHLLGEGFGCCWCCYLVLLLALLTLVLFILFWLQQRKLRNYEETINAYEEVLVSHQLMINGEMVE